MKTSRKLGLKTFDYDFDFFDEECILSYIEYLRVVKNMKNTTIEKNPDFLRWFLRWSLHKGFHQNFNPKSLKFVSQLVNFVKQNIKKEFKRQVTVYGDYFKKFKRTLNSAIKWKQQ